MVAFSQRRKTYCSFCGEESAAVDVLLKIFTVAICDRCVETAVAQIAEVRRGRADQAALNRFVAEAFDVWPRDSIFDIGETEVQPS